MRNVAVTILGSVVFSGLATIAAGQELSPAKAAIAKGGHGLCFVGHFSLLLDVM